MKNLILLAVQGAGKGTLAKVLCDKYSYAHISTGDILRERAAVGDEFGLNIKNLIDNGILVSDDIIYEAVEYRITQDDCKNGYILDGFPRTLDQAIGYDKIVSKLGIDSGIAVELVVPDDLLIKRLTGRRICKQCGAIYNIYIDESKPLKNNICDNCDIELTFRADDSNEEAIAARISTYHENAKPILDYYKEKGILHKIDGSNKVITLSQTEDLLNKLGE